MYKISNTHRDRVKKSSNLNQCLFQVGFRTTFYSLFCFIPFRQFNTRRFALLPLAFRKCIFFIVFVNHIKYVCIIVKCTVWLCNRHDKTGMIWNAERKKGFDFSTNTYRQAFFLIVKSVDLWCFGVRSICETVCIELR